MSTDKKSLRASLRAARRALTEEERRLTDRAIMTHIVTSEAFADATCVLLFYGVDGEVNLSRVATEAFLDGKCVGYPRVEGDGVMRFRSVVSLLDLTPDAYGIPAPRADAPVITPDKDTLMLVPALAIDRDGYRLGQGGGYYDRYLTDYPGITMGVIREAAYLPTLSREAHDLPMQSIVTEKQIYKVK